MEQDNSSKNLNEKGSNGSLQRQVAYKSRIKDIINGNYIKQEGWNPNYIITKDNKKISRVNLIGVVVSKPIENGANYHSIVLDDGGAKISARTFDDGKMLNNISIGDVVLLIGRPREYGQEKYIMPEIIRKIENKEWIEVRKLELKKQELISGAANIDENEPEKPVADEFIEKKIMKPFSSEKQNAQTPAEEDVSEKCEEGNLGRVYNLIKSMDNGDGVDYQEIIEKTNSEEEIENLLKEGEIYEIRPGRLKVL